MTTSTPPIFLQALSFHDIYGNTDETIHAAAELAENLGITGIDIEDRLLTSYEPLYLEELAHQVESRGVQLGYCGLKVDFAAPVSLIDDEIDRATKLIDAVPHLGISAIRVPGNGVVDGQDFESTFAAVRAKFERICEYAEQAEITVYLHNHNHGSAPSTGAQVLRMLDEVNSPALAYVLDTGQFQGSPGARAGVNGGLPTHTEAKPELYESIEIAVGRATMARTKFYFAEPGDERWLDYPRIVRILKNANFTGPISIVYEPQASVPSPDALTSAVRYLTQLFEN